MYLPQQAPLATETQQSVVARVVGGAASGTDLAKYMTIFLRRTAGGFVLECSGTLVSPSIVITAAHCFISRSMPAFVGLTNDSTLMRDEADAYYVESFHPHPLYSKFSDEEAAGYDIAYVVLNRSVSTTRSKFMKINVNLSIPIVFSLVRTSGYGSLTLNQSTSNFVLHQVDFPVVSSSICIDVYHDGNLFVNRSSQLCAGYIGRGGCGSWYVFDNLPTSR